MESNDHIHEIICRGHGYRGITRTYRGGGGGGICVEDIILGD